MNSPSSMRPLLRWPELAACAVRIVRRDGPRASLAFMSIFTIQVCTKVLDVQGRSLKRNFVLQELAWKPRNGLLTDRLFVPIQPRKQP